MTDDVRSADRLGRARALAHVLDDGIRIPGLGVRFGLDPLIGLVPGLGDLSGAVLSGYIVLLGARLGAPGSVIARMIGNIAVDTIGGSVPVIGDLFDVAWKSNLKNVALLDRWTAQPGATRRSSRFVLAATVIALIALTIGGLALTVVVIRALLIALRS